MGNPKIRGSEHEAPLVKHMDGTMHECLLYLPLFDEISRLEIGVDENARLEAAPNPFRHKVVVIGSSITHGTAASRPGMAYPARLNRTLGFEFPNLGASGQCKLDAFYAHIASRHKRYEAVREDKYFNALQLKYANAITCHKSQGGQWKCVFIDNPFWQDELLPDDLKWLYTALTRSTEMVYLVNFKDSFFE